MSITDRPCNAPGCNTPVGLKGAKGYCSKHYHRLMRYGDPLHPPKFTPTKRPATCTMDGCDKPCRARGLCSTHHQRWRVRGDPSIVLGSWGTREKANPLDRIDKTATHWYWTGYRDKKGYGWHSSRPAHVVIWELLVGPIPPGLQLDHVCRVHPCVRPHPDHLEVVTQQENMRRGLCISTLNAAKTHCPRDHEYSLENTYIDGDGGRRCRKCQKITNAAWLSRRRNLSALIDTGAMEPPVIDERPRA